MRSGFCPFPRRVLTLTAALLYSLYQNNTTFYLIERTRPGVDLGFQPSPM